MHGKKTQHTALRLARVRAMVFSKFTRGDWETPTVLPKEFTTDTEHQTYWRVASADGISATEPEIAEEPAQEPTAEPAEGDPPEPEETPETVPEPAEPMEPEPAPLPTTPPTPKPSNRAASRDNGPRTTKSAKNNKKRERGISVMTDAHLRAQPSVTTVVLDD